MTVAPSADQLVSRVRTMLCRLGRGLPIESHVLRPMTMLLPIVTCLKCFNSAGKCQGIRPSNPISLFLPIAAISVSRLLTSDRNRGFDTGVTLVVLQLEILEDKIKEVFSGRVYSHNR